MNRSHTVAALLSSILSLAVSTATWSADLQGAERTIAKIQSAAGSATSSAAQLPRGPLADEFNTYKTQLPGMTPDAAATGWLVLLDKVSRLPANTPYYGQFTTPAAHLLALLPSPDSWKAIEEALQKRPPGTGDAEAHELGWKLIGRILAADPAGQRDLLKPAAAAINRKAGLLAALTRSGPSPYDQLLSAYLAIYPDAKLQLESFQRAIAVAGANRYGRIEVPDLLDIVGEAQTRELAKKALLSRARLNFQSGQPTEKIFKQVALEQIDALPIPHWELITTFDDTDLFLALDKKFNKPASTTAPDNVPQPSSDSGMDNDNLQNARRVYITSLIYSGKIDDALKQSDIALDDSIGYSFAQDAADSGHGDVALQFLEALLTRHPEYYSAWNSYIQLAARTGQTDRMLPFVKKVADNDANPAGKAAAMNALRTAQLAADDVDHVIEQLRAQIPADRKNAPDQAFPDALLLTRLGTALQRPELQQEGIVAAHAALTAALTNRRNVGYYEFTPFIKQLLLARDYATAEQVITEILSTPNPNRSGNQRDSLVWLATLYSQAGRNDDVLTLLQKAPWWQSADLSDIMSLRLDEETPALGVIAAKALIAAGRNEEAKRILLTFLDQNPAEDDAYELLLPLMPDRFPALCDKLYARDAFEERPLIWKAEALRRLKKLDDAETAARQAIAVDPSDGETPHGRRMKVYAVLSDILKDKGQPKEAENYAQVVAAIRTAETADDLYEIGLLKRAIARYEEALTHFSDAYCIQSRLALKYSEAGLESLAEEHYQRAYELMPDSFGRVESHCFGCEGAFRGSKPMSIAERVFTTMAKKSPMKPQIHYLLGYLREEQDKIPEALAAYQEAVKLDPDYFNAWKKINGLLDRLGRGPDERDPVIRNLARLDPLNRHGAAELRRLSTPADFWTISAKARALAPDAGGATPKLFPLDAATRIINADPNLRQRNFDYPPFPQQTPDDYDPHTMLKNQFMIQAARLLQF